MGNGNENEFNNILNSNAQKVCVIAGPGSGKTKGVLIPKAKRIITDQSVNPENVLLLSFSRLSALDLKCRIAENEGKKTPRASTLHSLCLSFLLSEDNHDIRKRIDSILLDFEKDILISDLKNTFSNSLKLDKREIKKLLSEFSAGWAVNDHDTVFNENEIKKTFKYSIKNWLEEHEAALIEEVVYNAVALAKRLNTDFLNKIEYILVDEYQDMNKLEQEFIGLLAEKNCKLLLVVGDPYQSIYSFKFAHPEGIIGFKKRQDVKPFILPYSYRCSKKIIEIANQLLKQLEPTQTDFLEALPNAENGEVKLIRKDNQAEEFEFIYTSIAKKIDSGVAPKEILVLIPKHKLGADFKSFMDQKKLETLEFQLLTKNELNKIEKEKITLLTLLAKPDSLLAIRTFIGLKDDNHFSKELLIIKEKYGSLANAFANANPDDFEKKKKRLRAACLVINDLKKLLEDSHSSNNIDQIINNLFPEGNSELQNLRSQILSLKDEGDTLQDIYRKYIDSTNDISHKDHLIRILTLRGAKGLDAEHVYIMGCNDGNIPGDNRSQYLDDFRFKQEQLRLLFVGITRAKKTVTISWSRHIPYSQSMAHSTRSVRTIKINGETLCQVGLCGFLQDVAIDTQP